MSFGFSIGDFITAIELANRIRKEFVDAPNQFKDISNEVKNLSNVLRDIEDFLPERELTSQQITELHEIAEGCRDVLRRLKETLEKYKELDPSPKSFGKKARRVWKRLRWEPEDIKELRSRVVANITLLNAFQGRLASQISLSTKDGVDRLHERQDNRERHEEHQAILDWLTPVNYATQQRDFIDRRQEGTGRWLLDSDKFQDWLDKSRQTLFCPGIPGAGKTMITAIVVDHLCTKFQNDASVGVAYIYCNFRRQDKQKPADLLASLLRELVEGQPSVPESVKRLYECHKDEPRPPPDEMLKVLHAVITDCSRAFIIMDALDECQVSDGGRKRFLSEIRNLQAKTGASIFATSRFIPEIMKDFEGSVSLEIRASGEDVQRYLNGHMSQLPSFVLRSPDLQEEIRNEIIKAVDGMFLLAQLHLGSLMGKRSPKAIRTALKSLPTGSEAYDCAYKEAMERIEGQITDSQEAAKQVLSWITCAKRSLTTLELRHALAVEAGESDFDEDNLPEIEDMISVCAGLVTVDEESGIIRLIHYTTQEYFERTQKDWFPRGQTDIAITCVTYLSFDVFETGFCQTDEEFEARLRNNPLYDYAARNWGHHARAALTAVEQLILTFLTSEAKVAGSNQAMMVSRNYSGYSQRVPRQMARVHLAAYFGLRETIIALLKDGLDPDIKDIYGWTPLSWAVEHGHETVVKLLLATDNVNPDSKDIDGRAPLSWAAENGHEAVMTLLLATDAVDPDSMDNGGRTPLWWAAANGHKALAELLLATNGVNPDSKDTKYGQTPLSLAAENGHEKVVKLLLATDGVHPDHHDNYGLTPFSWAARNGHEAIVRLLLAKDGVDPDSKNKIGRAPLSLAAENGHEAVVKLLLAKNGIDPDSKDKNDRTPLSWAAANGHETVVKMLLATDAVNPDSKDEQSGTPLSWAARTGHSDIVKLLLRKYEEDGIVICGEDLDIATHPAADHRSRINCDICTSRIPDFDIHYHCRICRKGDFDLCQKCIANRAFCLDHSHKLIKRMVKDDTCVEVLDQP